MGYEAVRSTLLRFDQYNDEGVRFAPAAIDALIDACGGHPHLFQLVGEGAWDASPDEHRITTDDVDVGVTTSVPERAAIVSARLADLTDPSWAGHAPRQRWTTARGP